MAIRRFSSRIERLDTEFLAKSLKGATKYFRIAGYFRSSIFVLLVLTNIPEAGGRRLVEELYPLSASIIEVSR